MAVLVVFVGVIVDSGLSSWRIDRPVLAQVVVCLVLVAAGFIWFWIWCGFAGWELGSRLRLSGLTDDHEDELRAKLERRSATASRRETLMGAYLPVAFASFLIGIFVLLY